MSPNSLKHFPIESYFTFSTIYYGNSDDHCLFKVRRTLYYKYLKKVFNEKEIDFYITRMSLIELIVSIKECSS